MVEFMLNYFNVRGRGELIRLIFHMSGQKFEDVRIEPEEWSSHRSQFPLEQLPLLTIKRGDNQVTIGQSLTIGMFLNLLNSILILKYFHIKQDFWHGNSVWLEELE